MTQFGTMTGAPRQNSGLTNLRELAAYAIAQGAKIALTYVVSFSGLLSPVYIAAYRSGGQAAFLAVNFAISTVWGAVMLILFLLLRAGFGGVPSMIATAGRASAFISRGGEIGALAIAYLIVIGVVMLVSTMFLRDLYASLGRSGQREIIFAIGLSLSFITAAIVYPIFIGLRSAFCRASVDEGSR
jgi:hypothetical protein